jgi:Arc/MetJ-type ribon-helix-helix transcriptional regulator
MGVDDVARPKSRETREKLSITLPPDLIKWLESKVADRTFGSVSHGADVAIHDLQAKLGKPKGK